MVVLEVFEALDDAVVAVGDDDFVEVDGCEPACFSGAVVDHIRDHFSLESDEFPWPVEEIHFTVVDVGREDFSVVICAFVVDQVEVFCAHHAVEFDPFFHPSGFILEDCEDGEVVLAAFFCGVLPLPDVFRFILCEAWPLLRRQRHREGEASRD